MRTHSREKKKILTIQGHGRVWTSQLMSLAQRKKRNKMKNLLTHYCQSALSLYFIYLFFAKSPVDSIKVSRWMEMVNLLAKRRT